MNSETSSVKKVFMYKNSFDFPTGCACFYSRIKPLITLYLSLYLINKTKKIHIRIKKN